MANWVVVTGAGGIVGRAAVARLANSGWRVVPVVSPASSANIPGAIVADLTHGLPDVGAFSHVVHLAAALTHDARYHDADASGRLTRRFDDAVIDSANRQGARVVYASTCSLYDPVGSNEKTEDDGALRSDTPYRLAKRETERRLLSEGRAVIFRLSAPVGPGMFASTVLPCFIQTARSGGTIEVWGSGSREQNFVFADDVADFIWRAMRADAAGLYNVAGAAVSMRKLARLVVQTIQRGRYEMATAPDPLDGQTARYSGALAWRDLAWQPTTPLEEGIRRCKDLEFRR